MSIVSVAGPSLQELERELERVCQEGGEARYSSSVDGLYFPKGCPSVEAFSEQMYQAHAKERLDALHARVKRIRESVVFSPLPPVLPSLPIQAFSPAEPRSWKELQQAHQELVQHVAEFQKNHDDWIQTQTLTQKQFQKEQTQLDAQTNPLYARIGTLRQTLLSNHKTSNSQAVRKSLEDLDKEISALESEALKNEGIKRNLSIWREQLVGWKGVCGGRFVALEAECREKRLHARKEGALQQVNQVKSRYATWQAQQKERQQQRTEIDQQLTESSAAIDRWEQAPGVSPGYLTQTQKDALTAIGGTELLPEAEYTGLKAQRAELRACRQAIDTAEQAAAYDWATDCAGAVAALKTEEALIPAKRALQQEVMQLTSNIALEFLQNTSVEQGASLRICSARAYFDWMQQNHLATIRQSAIKSGARYLGATNPDYFGFCGAEDQPLDKYSYYYRLREKRLQNGAEISASEGLATFKQGPSFLAGDMFHQLVCLETVQSLVGAAAFDVIVSRENQLRLGLTYDLSPLRGLHQAIGASQGVQGCWVTFQNAPNYPSQQLDWEFEECVALCCDAPFPGEETYAAFAVSAQKVTAAQITERLWWAYKTPSQVLDNVSVDARRQLKPLQTKRVPLTLEQFKTAGGGRSKVEKMDWNIDRVYQLVQVAQQNPEAAYQLLLGWNERWDEAVAASLRA